MVPHRPGIAPALGLRAEASNREDDTHDQNAND
jgi:hypothetical protein